MVLKRQKKTRKFVFSNYYQVKSHEAGHTFKILKADHTSHDDYECFIILLPRRILWTRDFLW